MTLRVTPWGKDDFKATSEEAESKDWAYWQNRLNRASLVMLAEEGIIDKNIVPRIAAAQKHAEDLQNLPGAGDQGAKSAWRSSPHGHHAVGKNADRILR